MTRTFKKSLLIGSLLIASFGGLTYWYYDTYTACQGIQLYRPSRDRQPIIDLFKDNWYWLIPDSLTTFSIESYLDTNTKLQGTSKEDNKILVYCVDNKTIGMVAFYEDSFYKGQLRFIVLDKAYRGQGYAEKLMNYALDDMKKRGLSKVKLITRTNNEPARKFYLKLGLKELQPKGGYVEFEKDL